LDVGYSLYKPDRFDEKSPVCTLNVISGEVSVLTKNALTWEKGVDGMPLESGSRIKTEVNSQASVTFFEGTTTKLEPGTDLIVERLIGGDADDSRQVVLKQREGITWNSVASMDEGSFQIKTESADIVVHGTLFTAEVDESGATTVSTAEGLVNVTAQGEAVLVTGGQQTRVSLGNAPSLPGPIPPAKRELVFTVDEPGSFRVVTPAGSSTGYLSDGSTVNQVTGSQIISREDEGQAIRIPEAVNGEYSIVLHGEEGSTGMVYVEGYAEGERTFIQSESGNITEENDLVLKLHLDVLEGIRKGVSEITSSSDEAPDDEISEPSQLAAGNGQSVSGDNNNGENTSWYAGLGSYASNSWIISISVVVIFILAFVFVWRRT
jgi:hypothetical protein